MITFQRVNKWFGTLHVLRDVELSVRAGEVVVICGPSGSGKSTLIRCINKLEPIQQGQIIVNGLSLSHPTTDLTKLRAEVGMVFQQFNLYPHMTALQNITLAPIKVRKLSRAEAERIAGHLLAKVGILEKADPYGMSRLSRWLEIRLSPGQAPTRKAGESRKEVKSPAAIRPV